MRTAILCAYLGIASLVCFGSDDAQDKGKPAKEQVNPATAAPAKSLKAATPEGGETDPLKLAEPANGGPAGVGVNTQEYVIGAEEVVSVNVWHNADLSGTFLVQPDGFMAFPLIGRLRATGLTPDALGKELANKLSTGEFVRNPNVTVSIQQVNSRKYFVTGEMNKTGSFPLVMPTTILDAISNAGGFKEFANQKKIVILRKQPDGTRKELHFNYKDVIRNKHVEQNVYLQPDDHIIVR